MVFFTCVGSFEVFKEAYEVSRWDGRVLPTKCFMVSGR